MLNINISSGAQEVSLSGLEIKRRWLSDKHALDWISVFYENDKLSKSRDDSQWSDDQANINFDNLFVIPANTTITLAIVASIPSIVASPEIQNQNFFLEVSDIISKDEISFTRLAGENFRIWGVDEFVSEIEIDEPEANIRLGTTRMIWEFDIQWNPSRDNYIELIRFTTDYSELENDFSEIRLVYENQVVALGEIYDDEYIVFEIQDGLLLEADKKISLKILARVQSRVSETLAFEIEWSEDIVYSNSSGEIISGYVYQKAETTKLVIQIHSKYSKKAIQIADAIEKIISKKSENKQQEYQQNIIITLEKYIIKKPQHSTILWEVIKILSK